MLKTNLQYFYSTINDGNMNTNKNFYPEDMTKADIKLDFTERRIKLGEQLGFNGLKILTPIQKSRPVMDGKTIEEQLKLFNNYNKKYKDGHYVRITREMIEPYDDLYDLDIYSDILMIDQTIPEVALAYPVADCPVIIAEDTKKNIAAMAHCGGEYIDRELPAQIIDSLREEVDSNLDDIFVYVGPHAQKESFTYDRFPKFIHNEGAWNGCLSEKNSLIHINMDYAILSQLANRGVSMKNIIFSNIDTITNPLFYSNNRARIDKEKAGRFYTGCFYKAAKNLTHTLIR